MNCDLLVGLDGLHVVRVDRDDGEGLVVTVESAPEPVGCPACGVLTRSHGRRIVELVDIPCFGRPARIRWLKRRWICPAPACAVGTFQRAGRTAGVIILGLVVGLAATGVMSWAVPEAGPEADGTLWCCRR